jgi:hypothetical protein
MLINARWFQKYYCALTVFLLFFSVLSLAGPTATQVLAVGAMGDLPNDFALELFRLCLLFSRISIMLQCPDYAPVFFPPNDPILPAAFPQPQH